MERLRVKCPSCGGEIFNTARELQSYDDFIGAPCDGCGRLLLEKDIEEQAHAIISARIEKMFKGDGA